LPLRRSQKDFLVCFFFSKNIFTAAVSKKQHISANPQSYFSPLILWRGRYPYFPDFLLTLIPAPPWSPSQAPLPVPVRSSPGAAADLCSGAWSTPSSFGSHLGVLRVLPLTFFSPLLLTLCSVSLSLRGVFTEASPAWLLGSAVSCRGSAAEMAGTSHVWHRTALASSYRSPALSPQHLATDTQYKLATTLLKPLGHAQRKTQVK